MNTKMLLICVVSFGFGASASEGMVSSFTNSEVGPVMARKTSTAGRIAIAIAKLENKSEMPDSMLGELRSRMQQCIAGTSYVIGLIRDNVAKIQSIGHAPDNKAATA